MNGNKNTERKWVKCRKNCNRKSVRSSLIKGHTVVFSGSLHSNSKYNCAVLRKKLGSEIEKPCWKYEHLLYPANEERQGKERKEKEKKG